LPLQVYKQTASPADEPIMSVTECIGFITEPQGNSRYWPAPYMPKQNVFFNIQGTVTPVMENGQTTVVDVEGLLCPVLRRHGPIYRFETPLDENRRFAIKKSILLPYFSPCRRVTPRICLESEVERKLVPVSEPVDFWFKLA
jgi:hypothetical protein